MGSLDIQAKMALAKEICGFDFEGGLNHLREALLAPGAPGTVPGSEGNRPLALLGDKVTDLIITVDSLEKNFTTGKASARLQQLTSNDNLANICYESGLFECITFNPGVFIARGWLNNKTVAGFVESVVGAAYKTAGMSAVETVLLNLGVIKDETAYNLDHVRSELDALVE